MSVSASNANIKAMTQAELEATYSKNNNLKSLSVEGYEIDPAFNKDNLAFLERNYDIDILERLNLAKKYFTNINKYLNDSPYL